MTLGQEMGNKDEDIAEGFAAGSQLILAGVMLFSKTPQRFAPVNIVK